MPSPKMTLPGKSYKTIPGKMTEEELIFLQDIVKRYGVTSWTEIGGYIGKSMMAVAEVLPKGGLLQVVDLFLNHWCYANQNIFSTVDTIIKYRDDLDVVVCRADGVRCSSFLKKTDVIFLDGNHSEEQVRKEIYAHAGKCRILCGHDYSPSHPGVVKAVDDASQRMDLKIQVVGSVWLMEIKSNDSVL